MIQDSSEFLVSASQFLLFTIKLPLLFFGGKSQCFPLKDGKVAFPAACSGCFRLSETSKQLSFPIVYLSVTRRR
jgi:hypothetical protein